MKLLTSMCAGGAAEEEAPQVDPGAQHCSLGCCWKGTPSGVSSIFTATLVLGICEEEDVERDWLLNQADDLFLEVAEDGEPRIAESGAATACFHPGKGIIS